jgi:outer membrane protein assembly factor BamD
MRARFGTSRVSTGSPTAIRIAILVLLGLALALGGCRKDRDELETISAEDLYLRAKESLDNGAWDRAIAAYKALQTRYPFGRYTEQSMLDLSYCYFKAGAREESLSTLDRFIRTYPAHPSVDYAYYLKGLVNYEENLGYLERLMPARVRDRDQSSAQDAFNDFSELIRRFPESRFVPDARQRMVFLRNNLAAYELIVAEYYLRRKAYIAAANRARYALEVYPNTPLTPDALVVLHKAYTELDLPALAEGSMAVLELNFPDNYYVQGRKKKRSWVDRLWPFD